MNIACFSSHTTNTATVLCFVFMVFIGTTPSVAFADASGLVGYLSVSDDLPTLRLILCKWQSPSLRLILHPIMNPPTQKLYID